jgi:hypothetical protein
MLCSRMLIVDWQPFKLFVYVTKAYLLYNDACGMLIYDMFLCSVSFCMHIAQCILFDT